MRELTDRLNVTKEELETIRQTLLRFMDFRMESRENKHATSSEDMFRIVLNKEQYEEFRINAMTNSMCRDLLKF